VPSTVRPRQRPGATIPIATRHGVPEPKASTYAAIALATLTGMQMTQRPFNPSSLRTVYGELAQALGKNLAPA
jgi:hypothetical protein